MLIFIGFIDFLILNGRVAYSARFILAPNFRGIILLIILVLLFKITRVCCVINRVIIWTFNVCWIFLLSLICLTRNVFIFISIIVWFWTVRWIYRSSVCNICYVTGSFCSIVIIRNLLILVKFLSWSSIVGWILVIHIYGRFSAIRIYLLIIFSFYSWICGVVQIFFVLFIQVFCWIGGIVEILIRIGQIIIRFVAILHILIINICSAVSFSIWILYLCWILLLLLIGFISFVILFGRVVTRDCFV